ncbi:hypothetical protein [Nocardiopsis sp. CNR-923]|uniref:hypothetical protein n=1 Tax=Nocardiopsis sp. CNR-923 TaxID=1904965 RepID=UPI0013010F79|nr:hypothetical protein [Nocardiopsis sp. CNR-923]
MNNRITFGLVADVLKVLDEHGFQRGDDGAVDAGRVVASGRVPRTVPPSTRG